MKNKGFEIKVKENGDYRIYCVDSNKNIRGFYTEGFKHYMSDWELWHGKIGKLEGELKKGEKIIMEGETKEIEIIEIREININKKTKDQYSAGLDRPIFNPNFLS